VTSWIDAVESLPGPRYRAIAGAIAEAARDGRLAPGERLPTHRELASTLGLSLGAVTRAYRTLAEWGVVTGEVGRGTFIRRLADERVRFDAPDGATTARIDLAHGVSVPVGALEREMLRDALEAVAADPAICAHMRAAPVAGDTRAHRAGAAWLRTLGLDARPERIILCAGVQHAYHCVLGATMRPGDTLCCESMCYPGLRALATALRLHLRPVAIDGAGLVPDAFERACRESRPRALVCVPTGHTPTGAVMSPVRRRKIAEIARKHSVLVLEDDESTALLPNPPAPLATLAPDLGVYLGGTEIALAPGMRIAFVHAPAALVRPISEQVRATIWMVPAPMREAMTILLERGWAQRIVAARRRELDARRDLAHRALAAGDAPFRRGLHCAWLTLPEPWRADRFAEAAADAGVLVETPEPYVVGGAAAPRAVRVCLGAEADPARLEQGFAAVGRLLMTAPPA
jgi:DNA-binding transcriptional MocR family regulator